MPASFDNLKTLYAHGFDTVIDVRSPAEFAEDHIPGAINLPALDNDERARVGTIYKQESAFKARKIGAALVARNVAAHLDGPLRDQKGGWRPLVYCWRGGQRSGSFAAILKQIGWRAETIDGGYKSYRRLVNDALYDRTLPHRLILLDGYTGTGKTALLQRLSALGVQTIDLEGMAQHRGSLLGGRPGGQPAQKAFESSLAAALTALDPAQPVVVEAESSKIGRIMLPQSLWTAMCAAPAITIAAPLAARAAFLARAYQDMTADPDTLRDRLQPLRRLQGHDRVSAWEALLEAKDFTTLASTLMAEHYDPAYARSRAAHNRISLGTVHAEALDEAGLDAAASDIVAHVNAQ